MSEFKVTIERIKIEEHPNADLLDLAVVGDYRSIVQKGIHKDGGLVAYIPEQSVLPDWLIEDLNLTGKLAGSKKNRVKAVKLRGQLSQGICVPVYHDPLTNDWYVAGEEECDREYVNEGDDVAEFLGITKYEPPIPVHMKGKVVGGDLDLTVKFDFENLKRVPDIFDDYYSDVVITEKLHGTFCMIGIAPPSKQDPKHYKDYGLVSSKGLAAKGLLLDFSDTDNLYVKTAIENKICEKLMEGFETLLRRTELPIFILGEIYGGSIQDLTYGEKEPKFRAFDICMGGHGHTEYRPYNLVKQECEAMGIEMVPVLYEGPYSKEIVLKYTDGDTILNEGSNIREGVVIRGTNEIDHPRHGRRIAKSVSEAYLLRKNGTEYN